MFPAQSIHLFSCPFSLTLLFVLNRITFRESLFCLPSKLMDVEVRHSSGVLLRRPLSQSSLWAKGQTIDVYVQQKDGSYGWAGCYGQNNIEVRFVSHYGKQKPMARPERLI